RIRSKRVPFMFSIFVRITERNHMRSCARGFAVVIDNTATYDAKKPGSECTLILEGRQVLMNPDHCILNNIIPMVIRNVCCLYMDEFPYKHVAFVPLTRTTVP